MLTADEVVEILELKTKIDLETMFHQKVKDSYIRKSGSKEEYAYFFDFH